MQQNQAANQFQNQPSSGQQQAPLMNNNAMQQPFKQQQIQQQQQIVEETGIDYTLFNTDKSLMRCTTDRIPSTYESSKNSGIPFGIIVKPYGDLPAVSTFYTYFLRIFGEILITIFDLGRGWRSARGSASQLQE